MNCEHIQRLISIHPDDRTGTEEDKIRSHITTCEDCSREYERSTHIDMLISASLSTYGNKPTVKAPHSAAQTKEKQPHPVIFSYIWAAAASVLLIAGTICYVITTHKLKEQIDALTSQAHNLETKADRADLISVKLEAARQQINIIRSKAEMQQKRIAELEERTSRAPRTVNFNFFGHQEDQTELTQALLSGFPITSTIFKGSQNNETLFY